MPSSFQRRERVEQPYARGFEVFDVTGDQRPVVHLRRRRDQAVDYGHRLVLTLCGPLTGHLDRDARDTTTELLDDVVEPAFQRGGLLTVATLGQLRDASCDLSDGHGRKVQPFPRRLRDPPSDTLVSAALPGLRQDVGVYQIAHVSIPRSISLGKSRLRSASTSSPCRVIVCGPSRSTARSTSLKRCFASCTCHRAFSATEASLPRSLSCLDSTDSTPSSRHGRTSPSVRLGLRPRLQRRLPAPVTPSPHLGSWSAMPSSVAQRRSSCSASSRLSGPRSRRSSFRWRHALPTSGPGGMPRSSMIALPSRSGRTRARSSSAWIRAIRSSRAS